MMTQTIMLNKEARLELIRQRFQEQDDAGGVIPTTKLDVLDTVTELDGFQEFQRDKKSPLTSDEQ